MNNLIVDISDKTYIVRYQILKSAVIRKHTTKEGNRFYRWEKHPTSCEVHLYQILSVKTYDIFCNKYPTRKELNKSVYEGYLKYIGRGLSKCSDKDIFDKPMAIMIAVNNIKNIDKVICNEINKSILNQI